MRNAELCIKITSDYVTEIETKGKKNFCVLPSKSSPEQLQQYESRQDAKAAKKKLFYFLRTWRALRLRARYLFLDSGIQNSKNFSNIFA